MKKIVVTIIVLSMIVSLAAPVFAAHGQANSNLSLSTSSTNYTKDNIINNQRSSKTWISWASKIIFWVVSKASNGFYDVEATTETTSNMVRVNSGSIAYNSDTYGSMSYIDIEATSPYRSTGKLSLPNMSISLAVTTDFLTGLLNTMAVSLTDPNGEYQINQTLGTNGIAAYTVNTEAKEGTYRATYATTASQKWSATATIFDHYAPATAAYINGHEVALDLEHQKYYIIPSFSSKAHISTINTAPAAINVSDLYSEFWDETLGEFVYSLKTFDAGDTMTVTDTIFNITYEPSKDRSIIEFSTEFGIAYWPFDGNLTARFNAGDTVSFEFNVVEEYTSNNYTFENLDYLKAADAKLYNSNVSLNIDDYLVSHE